MHSCCAVDAIDGEGVIKVLPLLCLKRMDGFLAGGRLDMYWRDQASVGNSGSRCIDGRHRAGRSCSAFLPSRILAFRFAWADMTTFRGTLVSMSGT